MPGITQQIVEKLIAEMGGRFSRELGIDLFMDDPGEIFRWFLAAKLFGGRISTEIAMRTFREFEQRGVVTPATILATGWDDLVVILDAGGYTRYDFSTASRLLTIVETLDSRYGGNLNELHCQAQDNGDLERRLKALGTGIGDVTVNIFLRELRSVWTKARSEISPLALVPSRQLGLVGSCADPLATLEKVWSEHPVEGHDFRDLEAALVRLGKGYCRKGRHGACPFREQCAQGKRDQR